MMPSSAHEVDRDGMHAIRAPHVFDGTRFLTGGATVLLDGDRIVDVDSSRFEVPEGVEVTEFDGTVLPGLIDCHTHLVADATFGGLERAGSMPDQEVEEVITQSLSAHAAAGVTTVRDLGDRDYLTLGYRERPGLPRVVAAGPPMTTPGGHCHFLGGAVAGDPGVAVVERAQRGVDVVKVMASGGFATPGTDQLGAQFTPDQLATMVDHAHNAGLPIVAHAHSLLGIRNAVAAGVDGIEHFTALTLDGPQIDDDLLEEVARRAIYVDLTMGNDRSFHALMPEPPPQLRAVAARMGFTTFDEFYGSRISVLGRLRKHGVAVITGVDSGMGPPKRHGNVWRTVGEMVDAGYPVADALAAATSVAAEACGLGSETGRLAKGFWADLLLVDGDVSEDASLLSRPREVLVRGDKVREDKARRPAHTT